MKKLFFVFTLALLSIGLFGQNSGLGLGVIFGEPTGISAKLWTSERTAVDGAVAWSFAGAGWLHIHTDFLIHNYDLIEVSQGALPVYFGLGAIVTLASNPGLGARVPFGLAYQFEEAPLDIFVEVVPGLSLFPGIGFYMSGGIGIRYFF